VTGGGFGRFMYQYQELTPFHGHFLAAICSQKMVDYQPYFGGL